MLPLQDNQTQAPPSHQQEQEEAEAEQQQQQQQQHQIPSSPLQLSAAEFVPSYLQQQQQQPSQPLYTAPEFVSMRAQYRHRQLPQQHGIPVMQHFQYHSPPAQQHPGAAGLRFLDQSYMVQRQYQQQPHVVNNNNNAYAQQPCNSLAENDATSRVLLSETCYEALNLGSTRAGQQEIKEAYNRLAYEIHRPTNKTPGDTYAYRIIQHAAAILLDPTLRHQYETNDANRRVPNLLQLYNLTQQQDHEILMRFGLVRVRGILPHIANIEFLASGVGSGLSFVDFN